MKRDESDEQGGAKRPRLLVFIVAYNAERTIAAVLARIPEQLARLYDIEVLTIDDASADRTYETAHRASGERPWPFPIVILRNPVNQGYGGNQKIGFFYALGHGFDFVALLHGDGQYAPECLPELLAPLRRGEADAVLGSRMLVAGGARRGGMPLYKFVGNRILTWFQNRCLGMALSEFHSGYRLYSTAALGRIPFHLNSNDFHFDTEIIIQLHRSGQRIVELPIPTYYGDEICHVEGLRYAWNVVATTLRSRIQDLGLFYDRKYDCRRAADERLYEAKLDFPSPHTEALARLRAGMRVLDLGTGAGDLAAALIAKGCEVTGVDRRAPKRKVGFARFVAHDLDAPLPDDLFAGTDAMLMLDVIEHLRDPEAFVDGLRENPRLAPDTDILVSTGNVAFGLTRLGLLFGMFNYGKRGILDRTHTRLFTFATIRRLFEQAGFEVVESKGIPAPFPLALGRGAAAKALLAANRLAIRLWPGFFSYQIFLRVKKRPTLADLLGDARRHSAERTETAAGCEDAGA